MNARWVLTSGANFVLCRLFRAGGAFETKPGPQPDDHCEVASFGIPICCVTTPLMNMGDFEHVSPRGVDMSASQTIACGIEEPAFSPGWGLKRPGTSER